MNFTFNGNLYRIVFRHDPNRLLSAHIGHMTSIMKHPDYGVVTMCLQCKMVIGACRHTLPKALRVRKTWCVIQVDALARKIKDGEEISGIELARGERWKDVTHGCGRPNVKEGDRFNLKAGRVHSLQDALTAGALTQRSEILAAIWPTMTLHGMTPAAAEFAAFRRAAWTAFELRGQPEPKMEDYTVKITPGPVYETVRESKLREGGAI